MSVIRALFTRLENARLLDPVAEAVADAVHQTIPSARIADLLHGRWLGHPVHPVLVQVPIGAWVSASVLDFTPGGRTAARRLVGLGLLTAPAAIAAGLADWADLEPDQRRVGLVHAAANAVGTTFYAASWTARKQGRQLSGVGYALLGLAAVGLGGTLGGHLAYSQASGVNHAEGTMRRAGDGWQDLGPLDEIPIGEPVRRVVGDTTVVVYRRHLRTGGGVHVLASECSHVGGPLHEGEVTDGPGEPRITCPWHGSVFRLVDGEPLRGPATACQPVFRTEIVAGRLRARAFAEGSVWKNAEV
ncbi:Rieske 2Fe-2S domain-containing protein [Cryptosporangium aurantiacum]|uniref:Ferredoxin subunit of nitrite reductase or a ring-hydroxylating dioxygenase n=1 Tax=Cryptosporangium aurantiacum TaxID=134849 RepID=A0A1M7RPQ1_9ACTN|nr:Ferredoxin subunit of nitrite reductase or a ring-hydroxylating dioxygenase [Cryptosporangium aurantiacum]